MTIKKFLSFCLIGLCLGAMPALSVLASEPGPDDTSVGTPYAPDQTTMQAAREAAGAGVLTLYPNSLEILTLTDDAGSIILSNPEPVELIVENSRRLVLRPRQPGVTSLTVINRMGRIIYQRDIVVSARGDNYVRVKRMCEGSDCDKYDTYYCPDGCYDASSVDAGTGNSSSGSNSNTAQSNNSGSVPPPPPGVSMSLENQSMPSPEEPQ